jgi:DNA polymerase-3 subunit gamma/tau
MASQVFYRKWRPQTLAEVVGQEPVTQTLLNALKNGRISHAYLFCGPRGTGKTSTGRILAKAVNCLTSGQDEPCNTCSMCQAITEGRALDVIEIDAASNTGVDNIRDLREKVNYAPNEARYKVYIIDEFHMLSVAASNALLKTLEEPPPHAIFILATTEVHKILPTIMSRCQRFDFRRLSQADIASKLEQICKSEGFNIEPEAARLIARSATGSLRDAENLLEQLSTYYGPEISLQQVQTVLGITGDWRTRELVRHIINGDVSAGVATINNVNSDGLDLLQFKRELVEYLRSLLLIKTGSGDSVDLTAEDTAELKEIASKASLSQILKAVKLFGQMEIGFEKHSTLPLELAMIDCALSSGEAKESPAEQVERELPQPPKASKPATPPPPSQPAPAETKTQPEPETPPQPVGQTETLPAPPSEAGYDTEKLRHDWKRVIEEAPPDTKKSPALAILRSAGVMPVSVDSGTVVLSFRYSYHKEQIEKLENQRIAERIIGNFLGYQCQVQCVSEDNHLVKEALKMGAQIIDTEET